MQSVKKNKHTLCMTGQKLQLQLLQGRAGGAVEPVCVEDERVENENQDDGPGPDKEIGETGGGGGGKDIEQCDGHGDSGGERGGDGDDDSMEDDEDEDEVLEEDNGWGQEEEEEEEEEEEQQQHPFQEDHVDVTNLLDLLNRIVTSPLPRES
jgi:hypothetical protein